MQTQETQAPGVSLVPMDEERKNPLADIEARVLSAVEGVAAVAAQGIFERTLKAAQEESSRILSEVRGLAASSRVVAAVRVGDGPTRKLKAPAHPDLTELLSIIATGEMPLMVGPAGCGKSFLAEQAAEGLGLRFASLCFSAGVSETWLYGRQTPTGFQEAEFSRMYREGGLFLADELDAADSNLLMSINTALAANAMYNPISGQSFPRHPDFRFVGAANTFGKGGDRVYTARTRLDGATLDRFVYLVVDYHAKIEKDLLPDDAMRKALQRLRKDLAKRNSSEVVSYRAFRKAGALMATGKRRAAVLEQLFCHFPETLAKEVMLPIQADLREHEELTVTPESLEADAAKLKESVSGATGLAGLMAEAEAVSARSKKASKPANSFPF